MTEGTRSWLKRQDEGKALHGLGPATYLPGNISHLVSPLVGMLRLMEHDGGTPSVEDVTYMIDRLSFVLELAREEDEHPHVEETFNHLVRRGALHKEWGIVSPIDIGHIGAMSSEDAARYAGRRFDCDVYSRVRSPWTKEEPK